MRKCLTHVNHKSFYQKVQIWRTSSKNTEYFTNHVMSCLQSYPYISNASKKHAAVASAQNGKSCQMDSDSTSVNWGSAVQCWTAPDSVIEPQKRFFNLKCQLGSVWYYIALVIYYTALYSVSHLYTVLYSVSHLLYGTIQHQSFTIQYYKVSINAMILL